MADSITGMSKCLLDSIRTSNPEEEGEQEQVTCLDDSIKCLEFFFSFSGFFQSSTLSCCLSWTAFLILGLAVPVSITGICHYQACQGLQVVEFELVIVAFQACLSAASLICISHNLRKYGLRNFLFVDRFHGHTVRFSSAYVKKIKGFFYMLAWCMLPVFLLKVIRETVRISYVGNVSWGLSVVVLLALVVSWSYLTTVFLSSCILFNLVCNFQIIHFDEYVKLLERDSSVDELLNEHMRLTHHLSKISHRFRLYLIVTFLLVTSCQFITLFQTTGNHQIVNFITGGDFVVSSVVEVVGLTICLHAAAKISHRAQGVASVATRWHALITCSLSEGSQHQSSNSAENSDVNLTHIFINYSESDLESLDNETWPANAHFVSRMSSVQKRQALVMYLQCNPGGLTVFGLTVDRALINTIFFIEMSLVLFVLGKTIILSSE